MRMSSKEPGVLMPRPQILAFGTVSATLPMTRTANAHAAIRVPILAYTPSLSQSVYAGELKEDTRGEGG